MEPNTQIALTVLTDYLRKKEALLCEILEQLERLPGIPDAMDARPENNPPPCRTLPAEEAAKAEAEYTYEQVRGIFTEKISHGLKAEMKVILNAQGLKKLSDAKDDRQLLNRLAAEAEAIGNA